VCEDTATYQCETDVNTFQSWGIQLDSISMFTWTAVRTTPLRIQHVAMLRESRCIFEVLSRNHSLIAVLTITAAASLQGSIINCNGYRVQLNISSDIGE